MNSLNSLLIEGNLVRDPESFKTKAGTEGSVFTIANNRYYKIDGEPQDEVSYIEVKCYAKLAENCNTNLIKGRGCRVVGRIKQDRWLDADGNSCQKIVVIAEHIEFKPNFKKVEPSDK